MPAAGGDGRLYLRDQDLNEGAAAIRAAARRLSSLVAASAIASGISQPELDILEEVYDRGPMDVGDLRARLAAPKQSLARHLNSLQARGLLARAADQRDRRRRLVALTPQGLALTGEATERRRAALRQAFLSAGPDVVTGARRMLADITRTRGET
jgi:DNA-binding MarR family transcriptional regulator